MEILDLALQIGGYLIIVVIVMIIMGGIITFIWWRGKEKRYKQFKVLIWKRHKDKEGNEIPIIVGWDKGAVIKDKKLKQWRFHVKNWNIDFGEEETQELDEDRTLDIPSIPLEKGGECVFVEKLGHRKGALGKPFLFNGTVKVLVSSADCAEAIRSFELNARTFGKKDNPIWAFAAYIIMAAFILIIILVILNKFELIAEASKNFAQGAASIQQPTGDVITSNVPG